MRKVIESINVHSIWDPFPARNLATQRINSSILCQKGLPNARRWASAAALFSVRCRTTASCVVWQRSCCQRCRARAKAGPESNEAFPGKSFGNTMFVEFEGWFHQTRDTLNRCLGEACLNVEIWRMMKVWPEPLRNCFVLHCRSCT